MSFEEIKLWAIANKKGLVVGLIGGFILSRIIK